MVQLRICAYNPRTLCEHGRIKYILQQLGHYHIIALSGTACAYDTAVQQDRYASHTVISWSRSKHPAERAAGVSLAVSTRLFEPRNIVQVYEPHADYMGRMGAVRLRRGDCDVCVIVIYMWPEPNNVSGQRKCSRLWAYLRGFIERLPSRCVPILCGDFNGHVGAVASSAVDEMPETCDAIGPFRPELQNYNGGQLRQLLSSQHMRAENTFHDLGPTYHGGPPYFAQTRVDYICIPQARAGDVDSCKVLYAKGDRLQSKHCGAWAS